MALSIVYSPKDATTSPAIDIVAVHGLGGDAITTWTRPKSEKFWLRDFLPQQIPDARVMTFGYNADMAFGQSTADIVDHAKSLLASLVDKRDEQKEVHRPVIFIAHSLGGIVVKQALFQARLESRYKPIKDATVGLIFFGTPHRGSDKATYGKVLANVAQFISHRPPPRLLAALQTNSDILLRLTTDFRFQLPDYEVYSFFELLPMKGLSSLIVEKHSALLETQHEEQIPVEADHSAMCKFDTEDDPTFEKVYMRVKRMKNNPPRITNEQLVPNNTHFEVPHLLSPVFTGREEDLKCLTASFATRQSTQNHHQRRFVLFGLGGSGKTQICLKYAQDLRERYWGIFWVDASTADNIQRSFTQLARILQVDVDGIKRKLANSVRAWLLIFDNADDPDLNLSPYLPAGNRGDIIITSRNPECQHYNTVGCRQVGQLSPQDSISLLHKTIYGTIHPLEVATDESQKITESLGRLALAIVQAGAYIRETSCSLSDYLETYQRCKRDLLLHLPKHLGTDYQYSVYATWQISVDVIESKQDRAAHHALRLLALLGFYHPDQIPIQMFYNAWDGSHSPEALDHLPWNETFSDFLDYRHAVQASITLLASFSLVTRNTDLSVSLHPLVHEWCRERTSEDEEHRLSYRRALWLLTVSVKWEYASEDYTFRRSLVSHVYELLRLGNQGDTASEHDKIWLWPSLSLILAENGWEKDALTPMEEVVALQKRQLGVDHLDAVLSIYDLALQYSKVGRKVEALQLMEEVVPLLKSKPGADYLETLISMHSLAIRYSNVGRGAEALTLTEEEVRMSKSKFGADHPHTLLAMYNLAFQYSNVGRGAEALTLTEEVVRIRKRKLGADHPYTLWSIAYLAKHYHVAGRREEALLLMEKVVALQKTRLGADHPDTLESMHYLAILYYHAARRGEALLLMEKVVELRKTRLGADHPDTLESMHDLAILYCHAARQGEALLLMEKVVALQKTRLGADHPDTLESIHGLAILYHLAGRREEALLLMERMVALQKTRLGADHPDTLKSEKVLATLSQETKESTPVPESSNLLKQSRLKLPRWLRWGKT